MVAGAKGAMGYNTDAERQLLLGMVGLPSSVPVLIGTSLDRKELRGLIHGIFNADSSAYEFFFLLPYLRGQVIVVSIDGIDTDITKYLVEDGLSPFFRESGLNV